MVNKKRKEAPKGKWAGGVTLINRGSLHVYVDKRGVVHVGIVCPECDRFTYEALGPQLDGTEE